MDTPGTTRSNQGLPTTSFLPHRILPHKTRRHSQRIGTGPASPQRSPGSHRVLPTPKPQSPRSGNPGLLRRLSRSIYHQPETRRKHLPRTLCHTTHIRQQHCQMPDHKSHGLHKPHRHRSNTCCHPGTHTDRPYGATPPSSIPQRPHHNHTTILTYTRKRRCQRTPEHHTTYSRNTMLPSPTDRQPFIDPLTKPSSMGTSHTRRPRP